MKFPDKLFRHEDEDGVRKLLSLYHAFQSPDEGTNGSNGVNGMPYSASPSPSSSPSSSPTPTISRPDIPFGNKLIGIHQSRSPNNLRKNPMLYCKGNKTL